MSDKTPGVNVDILVVRGDKILLGLLTRRKLLLVGTGYSVIIPLVVIFPILLPTCSVNQMLPSELNGLRCPSGIEKTVRVSTSSLIFAKLYATPNCNP
jgi:hypothetical protein